MTTITRLLSADDVLLDVTADSKSELFELVGRRVAQDLGICARSVAEALERRELVGTTALGGGFAIPHARIGQLTRIRVFYIRLKSPLAFGASDGKPVSDLLVILVPKPATDEHLSLLAEATVMFSDRAFRRLLAQAQDADCLQEAFHEWPLPTEVDDLGMAAPPKG